MDNRDLLFAIHISLGVLSVIIAITTACYCKVRMRFHAADANHEPPPPPPHISSSSYSLTINEKGLDESTLHSFPKLVYSDQSKLIHEYNSTTSSCCSICLADYKEKDMLRVLPDCRHLFHVRCVDPWLRLHPTCPLCRT